MAKTKYVTNDYIEKVEHYLYNNLPLSDLEDVSNPVEEFNPEVVKEVLKKGERWVQLKDHPHVIVTDKGRLINTYKIRQYHVRFTPNTLIITISSEKVEVQDIFEEQGWEWNLDKIKRDYSKYNWNFRDYSDYKEYYNSN